MRSTGKKKTAATPVRERSATRPTAIAPLTFSQRHERMKASFWRWVARWRKAGVSDHEICQHVEARAQELCRSSRSSSGGGSA